MSDERTGSRCCDLLNKGVVFALVIGNGGLAVESMILGAIESRRELLVDLSAKVWELAETSLKETGSARLLASTLGAEGFTVSMGSGGLDTAVVAEYGSGPPVLGVLGEYDALPGLSQEASPQRRAIVEGGPGHGCGHNLLGVASLGAAVALKQAIATGHCPGTIRFYGCPAEETLSGKVLMAAAGAFDDLDVCLTWHPGSTNGAWSSGSLALNSVRFTFHGRTSHAAASPDVGRSALDAVELMNVGANYLREHISPDARIHYVITGGGDEPNVVPAYAQVWYYVRAGGRREVDDLYARLIRIAEGACLMTDTTFEVELLAGCHDYLPNNHLTRILWDEMNRLGAPAFDSEDEEFARDLVATLEPGQIEAGRQTARKTGGHDQAYLHKSVVPWQDPADSRPFPASTDVGDVSWLVPTGQFNTACAPLGVASHTWQFTASSGSSVGEKGMLHAARILALAGYRLLACPGDVQRARDEFGATTESQPHHMGF